jgi:hypothetical protein
MRKVARQAAADRVDQYLRVHKADIVAALLNGGVLADAAAREKFRCICATLTAILHCDYFALLDRLRRDYYYFAPEIAPHAAMDRDGIERAYADLLQSVDTVLKDANFVELPHAEIADAHARRTLLRVEVEAPLEDFRDVRFYRRGRHFEAFEQRRWFGLRRRKIEAEVYDDVVLLVATKSTDEIGSRRKLRALERRKIRPGSVLLKYFRNVAVADLKALFPNVRVVMSSADKLMLGVPALAGGIPILLNLYATITVLFVVIGFYLGVSAAVEDKDMKTALAALSGLVALGSFIVQQWIKYQRQSLKYRTELTDNVYFRNVNNNAGIFDYLVGAAEQQECKEVVLAYYFLLAAPSLDPAELESRIESWLRETFGAAPAFKVGEALARLDRIGLIRRDGERVSALPLDAACTQLRGVWERLVPLDSRKPG